VSDIIVHMSWMVPGHNSHGRYSDEVE